MPTAMRKATLTERKSHLVTELVTRRHQVFMISVDAYHSNLALFSIFLKTMQQAP